MSAFRFPRRARRTLFAQGEWETAENRGGGAGGIRTHDRLLTYTHFPGERLRPLGHRSAFCSGRGALRSEEHTSELQSLMRISYAVFCLKKKKIQKSRTTIVTTNDETQS